MLYCCILSKELARRNKRKFIFYFLCGVSGTSVAMQALDSVLWQEG